MANDINNPVQVQFDAFNAAAFQALEIIKLVWFIRMKIKNCVRLPNRVAECFSFID